jgi:hypothetical protein
MLLHPPKRKNRFWNPTTPLFNGHQSLFPQGQNGPAVKETPLGIMSSFKSEWSYSSNFQYVAVARTRSYLTFLLLQIFCSAHPILGFGTICHEVSIRLQTTDRHSFTASATLFNIKIIAHISVKILRFLTVFDTLGNSSGLATYETMERASHLCTTVRIWGIRL